MGNIYHIMPKVNVYVNIGLWYTYIFERGTELYERKYSKIRDSEAYFDFSLYYLIKKENYLSYTEEDSRC